MIDAKKTVRPKRKRSLSVLSLSFDGSQLDGVVVRRTNGSVQLLQTFTATLSLSPLTADPELVGREIRNQLDAAGIRERHCLACIPAKWALTVSTDIPPLPEEDIENFLQIETERGFASDISTLRVATSRYKGGGKEYATSIGVPNANSDRLEKALTHARLKPASFSPGISVLEAPDSKWSDGVLALLIGESQIDLQITSGGGVVAFRTVEGCIETEGSSKAVQSDRLLREIRITIGQLPSGVGESIRSVRIYGPRELAERLAADCRMRLEALKLEVTVAASYRPGEFEVTIPSGAAVSPALSFAARWLSGAAIKFDFLPPKVTPWQQMVRKYSSGPLQMVGGLAAAIIILTVGAFAYQQWQLSSLQGKWAGMSRKVSDLDDVQHQIRQYGPWFDESFRCLNILKLLTEAFPEDPSVSAKMIEIRNTAVVTCSGTAQNADAFLKTRARLQATDGVTNLKVDQMRGKSPVEFTFDFHWNDGGNSEN